jgi:hypothetical protein
MTERKRFNLISCEILHREITWCVARCRNIIDVTFLPKGLHDVGECGMSGALQEAIDGVDASRCEAILLGYGLCNNGIRGLRATVPLVVPRAHDCITLLLGSKERYRDYFSCNPGTYFKSTGWIERDSSSSDDPDSIPSQLGLGGT